MSFPRFSIRDMVNAEHRMLTECLGIKKLVAVAGSSMGGIETMQWAVSFPTFMEAAIPGTPMARANRQGNFIWEAVRQVVMVDPKWRDGNYPNDDPPRAGIGVGCRSRASWVVRGGLRAGILDARAGSRRLRGRCKNGREQRAGARLGLSQLGHPEPRHWPDAQFQGRPGGCGALGSRPGPAPAELPGSAPHPAAGGVLEVAQHIPTAKLVDLDDPGGHRGSRSARSLATFDTEVKDLLNRIAEGKPGFSGPRFPKNFDRPDFCPR